MSDKRVRVEIPSGFTEGPWSLEKPSKDEDGWQHGVMIAAVYGGQRIYADPPGGQSPAQDAALIALAPSLATEVVELRALVEEARGGAGGVLRARLCRHWRRSGQPQRRQHRVVL